MATKSRGEARQVRKMRVRRQIRGTKAVPRLCVFRSLRFTYAQLISDETNEVLASATSKGAADVKSQKSVDAAKVVGLAIAKIAKEKQIERVVFDRNGYLYHGRVEAVAQGAREGGLEF